MTLLLNSLGILALLILTMFFSVSETSVVLTSYYNMTMLIDQVDYIIYNARPCDCRQQCVSNSSCEGVSVKGSTCAFTTQQQQRSTLQDSHDGTRTYLKPMWCTSPFEILPELGCIFLSNELVNGTEVKTVCPEGSKQWYAATSTIYTKFVQYIRDTLGLNAYFHAGLEKHNGTWKWLDGHTMNDTDPRWYTGEPNCRPADGDVCAYIPKTWKTIIDTECINTGRYVCTIP